MTGAPAGSSQPTNRSSTGGARLRRRPCASIPGSAPVRPAILPSSAYLTGNAASTGSHAARKFLVCPARLSCSSRSPLSPSQALDAPRRTACRPPTRRQWALPLPQPARPRRPRPPHSRRPCPRENHPRHPRRRQRKSQPRRRDRRRRRQRPRRNQRLRQRKSQPRRQDRRRRRQRPRRNQRLRQRKGQPRRQNRRRPRKSSPRSPRRSRSWKRRLAQAAAYWWKAATW